jgi:hypothetical protein
MSPASSGPTDEATLRQKLSDLLNQRFPSNPKTVSATLAQFDSDKTKQIVPDPRLRAALLALRGTVGDSAIAGALDGTYSTVKFGTPIGGEGTALRRLNSSQMVRRRSLSTIDTNTRTSGFLLLL